MVNYKLTSKMSVVVISGILIVITIVLLNSLPYFLKIKKEQNYIQSISDSKKITNMLNDKKVVLDTQNTLVFLKELKSEAIGYQNTHPIAKFYIKLETIVNEDYVKQYYLAPDSDYVNKYWILLIDDKGESEIKRIQSAWLTKFLKEINFFDHSNILEK
jgi:hypothetical protein